MINFFQFATDSLDPNVAGNLTDASLYYLGRIFGNMYNIIPQSTDPQTGSIPATGNITILSYMFKSFNGVILTVGALLVVYITITGTLITAHEGEFMGKKYHQLWTPLRTVLGIAALVPTPTGYSAIQLIMMWVIVQGIGAADMLWSTALQYIGALGSPYAQASVPATGSGVALNNLFQALTCAATSRQGNPDGLPDNGNYYCQTNQCSAVDLYDPTNPNFAIGPAGLCGTLTTCDQNSVCSGNNGTSLSCTLCNAQTAQVATAVNILQGIAGTLATRDYQYRTFYAQSYNKLPNSNPDWGWIGDYCKAKNIPNDQCCIPAPSTLGINISAFACKATGVNAAFYSPTKTNDAGNPSPEAVAYIYWPYGVQSSTTGGAQSSTTGDFMGTIVTAYTSALTNALNTYLKAQNGQNLNNLPDSAKKALQTGWIFAGSYFYVISQMNNQNNQSVPDISISGISTSLQGYRVNTDAASVLAQMAAGIPPSSAGDNGIGQSQQAVTSGFNDVGNVLGTLGQSSSNPIAQMQQTGMALLAIVQIIFVVITTILLISQMAGYLAPFVLGTGIGADVGPAELTVSLLFLPALLALLGLMITLGGLLGVYVPLIPYMIFTFGAIGWFISIVEAMVAGPLVALGILSPSGQHEILGKAEPAIMLLFSIFLRPSLMIFGFFAGILLASVVADMINTAFWTTVAAGIATAGVGNNAGANGAQAFFALNPLEGLIFIAAYVSIIVSAMNKCFAAIHIVPEQVMGWIQGQAAQRGGEGEAVGEMKSGVAGASGGARSALGGAASGAKGVGKGIVKKDMADKAAAKEAADQLKAKTPKTDINDVD